MVHNSAPHRIFRISELTRLIAGHLILINPKSTVNLACACRHLEEPALSVLWETQSSLGTLLKVLPEETWNFEYVRGRHMIRIVEDPSPEAWNRVRGYASRMRQVRVNDQPNVVVDTFHRFCLSSPPGGWFPALQDLYWGITESNLPFANLFFSPHLEKISIYTSWPLSIPEDPQKFSAAIASMISALPTSALQLPPHLPGPTVRCSDKPFNSASPPPYLARRMPSASPRITFTPVFPPLVSFVLGDGAHGWFSLFGRMEDGTHVILQYTIYNKIRRRLESSLEFRGWEEVGRESLLSSLGGGDSRYGGLVALPYTTDSSWFGRAPTHATA